MRRRDAILGLGTATLTGLAGCSSSSDSGEGGQQTTRTTQTTATTTTYTPPEVKWNENLLDNGKYRLSVTVTLHSAEKVEIHKGTSSGKKIATIKSNGEHKIAGPNTSIGALELGQMFVATVDSSFSDNQQSVSMYDVGMQEQKSTPTQLNGVHGAHFPEKPNGKTFDRTFRQSVNGRRTSLSVNVPKGLYNYYKSRMRTREYGVYASDTLDDSYMSGLADTLKQFGERNNLSKRQVVDQAVAITQNMKYTSDKVTTGYNEYPKFPVETLVDRGGDCEDTCIFLSSLLQGLGYGSKLVVLPNKQHMALGVLGDESIDGTYYEENGNRYYYVETTSSGWRVGQIPDDMKGAKAKLIGISDRPVLLHQWAVSVSGYGADVVTQFSNTGKAVAKNASMQIQIKAKGEGTVASAHTSEVNLKPGESHKQKLSLMPPDDKTLRVVAKVGVDGKLHDRSKSDWNKPVTA